MSKKSDNGIIVTIIQVHKKNKINSADFKKLIRYIFKKFNIKKAITNIVISNDNGIRSVNSKYLGKENLTDVISFDLSENCEDETKYFDIVVNLERAIREAKERGHSKKAELALYITHGMLHNLGYNDTTKKQARKMHDAEDRILQEFGFGNVYNS